ncbi:MAG TPA: hypothetical protein VKR58_05755 [Aquella sp.]|nr:hypothetical protein [Aquella sp.]
MITNFIIVGIEYLTAGLITLLFFAGLAKSQGTVMQSTRDKCLIPIFWWVYLVIWMILLINTGYKELYKN